MRLGDNEKTAMMQMHGAARTAKEMGQDTRTLKALARKGLARYSARNPRSVLWSLTPEGVDLYNSGALALDPSARVRWARS